MSMNVDEEVPEVAGIADARQLGAAIRAERVRRGMTQAALAERAGVSRAWLARFETGHPAAQIEQLLLVLRAFDLGLALEPLRTTAAEQALLAELAKRRDR